MCVCVCVWTTQCCGYVPVTTSPVATGSKLRNGGTLQSSPRHLRGQNTAIVSCFVVVFGLGFCSYSYFITRDHEGMDKRFDECMNKRFDECMHKRFDEYMDKRFEELVDKCLIRGWINSLISG